MLALLREQPLIVSVQASEGSPVDDTGTLLKLAQASLNQGVRLLRLEGAERIAAITSATGAPVIGLVKRSYPGSDVYITPTCAEVDEVIAAGASLVALDATLRQRPKGEMLQDLIARIHGAGRLAMADCDCLASAKAAIEQGVDLVGTTLAGYTGARSASEGPDLDLLREIARCTRVPLIAEGRFRHRWEVEAALRIGAAGVVVGGAINDPVKTTRHLRPQPRSEGVVGAFDLGGTWMRFALFSPGWDLLEVVREPLAPTRKARDEWMRSVICESGAVACGVSTGGTVDPDTGEVWEAKPIIPEHVGSRFDQSLFRVPTTALNDGLASAWGHANLPDFAGRRVATLALGTGVGCGFVAEGRIWHGSRGEYPRINDLSAGAVTFEDLLGGAALSPQPDERQKSDAVAALRSAVQIIRSTLMPQDIVVCGSVGLSSWMQPVLAELDLRTSPFGGDAGLFGAAALCLFPPR